MATTEENNSNYGVCGLCLTDFDEDGYCPLGHKCRAIKCRICAELPFGLASLLVNGRCTNGCKQRLDRCELKRCQKYLLFGKCSVGHDNTRCMYCNNFLKNGNCHSQKCPKNKCKNHYCKGYFDFKTNQFSCWHTEEKCAFCSSFMTKNGRCWQGHDIAGTRCKLSSCKKLLEYRVCPNEKHQCVCGECILPLDMLPGGVQKTCPKLYCKYPGCGGKFYGDDVCHTNLLDEKCKKCDINLDHYKCPIYDHYFYYNCDKACFLADPELPAKAEKYDYLKVYRGDNCCPLGHNGRRCTFKIRKCLICDDPEAGEHICEYQSVKCRLDLKFGVCSVNHASNS